MATPMVSGLIASAKPSKSGKTLSVNLNGIWYSTKMFELSQKVGQMVEVEVSDSDFDGTTIHWINGYASVQAQPQAQGYVSPQPNANMAPQTAPVAPQGANGDLHRYQPLVSNLAAHIIAAGGQPGDLTPWFEVCKGVLEGRARTNSPDDPRNYTKLTTDGGTAPVGDFEDDIPF